MDIIKDIKELSMAAGIADTFHGRDCCSALDRLEDYIEELRKERDELADILDDICHSAFEHGSKNLSGRTLDPDGELLWKAKELVNKIKGI